MVFKLEDLPKNTFEKFIEFIDKGKPFDEVYRYYRDNNLKNKTGQPVVYKFKSLTNKCYYGKADDIFRRLNDYISLNLSYVNTDLKEDIINYGQNYFLFSVVTKFNDVKITQDNILDAENFYTSRAASSGVKLYNKTNTKLKLTVRTAKPAKNLSKAYKKVNDDFKGFGDIFY